GIRDPLVTGVQTCALPIYGRVFLTVKLVAWITFLGGIHHHLDQTLANHWGTEADGHKLVYLSLNFRVKAHELKVASAMAALSNRSEERRVGKDGHDRYWNG